MSTIKTWFVAFYKDYICLNTKEYHNIGFDFEIVKVLLVTALVLCIVFCVMDFHKKNAYVIIKQLMRHEAKDPESAKTLSEIGLSQNKSVRRAIESSSQLKSVVGRVGEKVMTYEEFIALEKKKRENKLIYRIFKKKKIQDENNTECSGVENENVAPSIDTVGLYIKPERADYASRIYNGADISVVRTALRCVLVVAVAVCFTMLMPELLTLVNNMLG